MKTMAQGFKQHGLALEFLLYEGNDTSSKLFEALLKIKSVIFSRDRVSLAPSLQSSCLLGL